MNKRKVAIFGVGAIGSVIAHAIYQNENISLSTLGRTYRKGIKLIHRNTRKSIPLEVQTKLNMSAEFDWLIICLKAHQYVAAAENLKQLIRSNTKVVVIRNGINLKNSVIEYVDEKNIIECIIDCPTQKEIDGYYCQFNQAKLNVSDCLISSQFIDLFQNSEAEIRVSSDFKTDSWKKLCESAALGATLCLANDTFSVFADSRWRKLHDALLEEAIVVARADGAAIDDLYFADMSKKLLSYPATKGSSMLSDLRARRPLELGAKNEAISSCAKHHGLDAPLNDLVCELLRM